MCRAPGRSFQIALRFEQGLRSVWWSHCLSHCSESDNKSSSFSSTSWAGSLHLYLQEIYFSITQLDHPDIVLIRTANRTANSHACTFMGSLPLSDSFPSIICLRSSYVVSAGSSKPHRKVSLREFSGSARGLGHALGHACTLSPSAAHGSSLTSSSVRPAMVALLRLHGLSSKKVSLGRTSKCNFAI